MQSEQSRAVKHFEDEIATLIYDVATRLITLEGDFDTSVHIKETYKPDED